MKNSTIFFTIIIFCFLCHLSYAQAPDWQWAKSAGGADADVAQAIAADRYGNVYVTGRFHSATLTMGTTTLTNSGSGADLFLAKYDAYGNVLWAKSAGGNDNDFALSVATDTAGNVFVTGFVSTSILFDTVVLTNPGFFIAKYDTDGHVLWAKSASNICQSQGNSVVIDAFGNAYVGGWYYYSDLSVGTITLQNNGSADMFIAKYDASGNVLWAKTFGNSGLDLLHAMALDVYGNLLITGEFSSPSLIFDTITIMHTIGDSSDIFLAKLDADGNILWAKSEGGVNNDASFAIATDNFGNVFIAGNFYSSPLIIGSDILTSYGNKDLFVAKYDTTGNSFWAKKAGGSGEDCVNSIAIDTSGNAYLTGLLQSYNATFDNLTLTNKSIYLAKYSTDGILTWLKSPLSDGGAGLSLATDASENIYLAGIFSNNITFDSIVLSSTSGSTDIFLAKTNSIAGTGIYGLTSPANIIIYPNPTTNHITIDPPGASPSTYALSLTNIQGQRLLSQKVIIDKTHTLDLSTFPNGIYFLNLQNEKENYVGKVVVQK